MITVTGQFTKKALIRKPGYPTGQPAPLFINCVCGHQIENAGKGTVTCSQCGLCFDADGWIIDPAAKPKPKRCNRCRSRATEQIKTQFLPIEDVCSGCAKAIRDNGLEVA